MSQELEKKLRIDELEDLRNGNHSLGDVYRFLRRIFDESIAEVEFQRFMSGELSERVLARSRELVEDDNCSRRDSRSAEAARAAA